MTFVVGHPQGGPDAGADRQRNTNSPPKCPPTIWVQRKWACVTTWRDPLRAKHLDLLKRSFFSPLVPAKCAKARELFCTVKTQIAQLKTRFPAEQYYRLDPMTCFMGPDVSLGMKWCWSNQLDLFHSRFHEHWRFVLQRLAFLSAFVVYLESENLVTRDEVAQILGSRFQFVCHVLPLPCVESDQSCDWSSGRKILFSKAH